MKNRFPRMALTSVVGLLVVLALAPVRPVFSQAAGGKQTPSKAAAKTLKAAEDAVVINSTALSEDEVLARVEGLVAEKLSH